MMKCQPKGHPQPSRLNGANGETGKNDETAQEQDSMTTPDFIEHIGRLQGVSNIASRLSNLLREQISSLSHAIPIQRGSEMLNDLRVRAKSHRENLETAFDPLRDQIERIRSGFWDRHSERLERGLQEYARQKVEVKVKLEIEKKIGRYEEYLKKQEMETKELKKAAEVSDVRLKNSLLSIKYPQEPVTWIGNLPDGVGPVVTFEGLINVDAPLVFELARSLGLSPVEGDDHLGILNKMMRHLGIAYKGLPSCAGVLLVPTKPSL